MNRIVAAMFGILLLVFCASLPYLSVTVTLHYIIVMSHLLALCQNQVIEFSVLNETPTFPDLWLLLLAFLQYSILL